MTRTNGNHPGAVLWDLDGTLIDSAPFHYLAWQETLRDEGVLISHEQFTGTFGQRNDLVLRTIFGPQLTAEHAARIAAHKEQRYRALVSEHGVTFLPGAKEWLTRLRAEGRPQALTTSAPRENVAVVLRALDAEACFDAVVVAEDVIHGKPDPEVFLVGAQRLSTPARCCVVVEDAPAGVEGAHRAGMRVIGVGPADLLAGADHISPTLEQLSADRLLTMLGCRAA